MEKIDLEKRRAAVELSEAINAIEGVPVSQFAQNIYDEWAQGKITDEQMQHALREHHVRMARGEK